MPDFRIVVDANVVVPLLVAEENSALAFRLWKSARLSGKEILAPGLIIFEVTSAVYRKAFRKLIDWESAKSAIDVLTKLNIHLITDPLLLVRAFEIARELGRPTTYDAHYLAVAEHFDAIFWTADEKLYNVARDKFSWIKLLRDLEGDVT